MKESFKTIRSDKIIRWALGISGGLLLAGIVVPLVFYISLPPFIPIFNQMPWGEARLGIKLALFLPAGIALLFFLTNFFFLAYLYPRMPLVSRILAITTLLIALLSMIYTLQTLHVIL